MSGLGVLDERLGRCDEGAGAGEADAGERPEAALVEIGEFVEGVVARRDGSSWCGRRGP